MDNLVKYTDKDMLAFKQSEMTLSEYNKQRVEEVDIKNPYLYQHILTICSQVTGADVIKTLSKTREPDAVFARYMTMFFMKKIGLGEFESKEEKEKAIRYTYDQLGAMAGGKDHATAWWGIKAVEGVIDVDSRTDKRTAWFYHALDKIQTSLDIKIKN